MNYQNQSDGYEYDYFDGTYIDPSYAKAAGPAHHGQEYDAYDDSAYYTDEIG